MKKTVSILSDIFVYRSMIGVIDAAGLCGFGAKKVKIEADINRGLPSFCMVGLAENSVKESRVRVQSAITNSGLEFPRSKISINLAPADVRKEGTAFDLSIALAILKANGVLGPKNLENIACVSELSLSGDLRPVRGILALAENLKEQGYNTMVVAKENFQEASLIQGLNVRTAASLAQLVEALKNNLVSNLPQEQQELTITPENFLDMEDVCGQEEAKKALLIAAAGNHNVLMMGGPGSGKSMMAQRLPGILPDLSYEESLLLTKVYSLAGRTLSSSLLRARPFRSPHHSITKAGLIGGGSSFIRPGEISLACYGVLFLDEMLEFNRSVLEVLRQPLESDEITISRANQNVTFPAKFSLIAAANPCPCGNLGIKGKVCTCSSFAIEKYQSRLSGPLVDRIDIHIDVPSIDLNLMANGKPGQSSKAMKEQVVKARARQKMRFKNCQTNGKMSRREIKELAMLTNDAQSLLIKAATHLHLSPRSFDRIIKIARTVADLDESEKIYEKHLKEALHYRGQIKSLGVRHK